MPDLASFQRDFAAALMAQDQPAIPFRSQSFAVYRNTSARGSVEALRAAYPTVDMLVGEAMFTQVALDYRRERPPSSPVLSDYGADFPHYLARQPWTSELPYLADVARLDWLWLESFLAADPDQSRPTIFSHSRIMLHPAARFGWFATPAMTIWQAHRDPWEQGELEPEWREEGALFTRPGSTVCAELIDAACHRLLLACSIPTSVGECATSVAEAFPTANVPELLRGCVASGALIIL
ncbi:MAG: DNA-binding domain-containing protein [Pseudomonadota bacterium]|nr:DNA-binding domain-containing protein [Pseudomonadota bacterium]